MILKLFHCLRTSWVALIGLSSLSASYVFLTCTISSLNLSLLLMSPWVSPHCLVFSSACISNAPSMALGPAAPA